MCIRDRVGIQRDDGNCRIGHCKTGHLRTGHSGTGNCRTGHWLTLEYLAQRFCSTEPASIEVLLTQPAVAQLLFASDEQLCLLQTASERQNTEVYFDATFKVVPWIYYQLFTLFVPFGDAAFPVVYALMSRKTQKLYRKIFEKVHELAPQFAPTDAMADFEEASVIYFLQTTSERYLCLNFEVLVVVALGT